MIDIALNSQGDLLLVNLGASLVTNVDQVAQNLAIRLKFIQGEWFLNILAGLPYYQYFFIKEPNQIQIESFLKDEIANTNGVEQITSFSSSYNAANRTFGVGFGCQAFDEFIELNLELP